MATLSETGVPIQHEPKIEILPMPQRSEVRDIKEDWTGKSSTVLRRKLQNRLNKRASRKSPLFPNPAPD